MRALLARSSVLVERQNMKPLSTSGVSRELIVERLNAALKRTGKTKAQIQREVGASSWQVVQRWFSGEAAVSPDYLAPLAKALDMTPWELLGVADGQDPPFESWREFLAIEGATLSADERRILAGVPWIGRTPTLSSYVMLLAAVRAANTKP